MKKLFYIVFCLFSFYTNAQDYKIDGSSIVVSKVVENIKGDKNEIYKNVKSFFVRNYGNADAVIQTDDKEGGLIIGKGLYGNLSSFSLGAWTTKAYHIIKVDIKDGRARIIASAESIIPNSSQYLGNTYEYKITDYYPITEKKAPGMPKKASEESLNRLIINLNNSVTELEKTILDGGKLSTEKEDW